MKRWHSGFEPWERQALLRDSLTPLAVRNRMAAAEIARMARFCTLLRKSNLIEPRQPMPELSARASLPLTAALENRLVTLFCE